MEISTGTGNGTMTALFNDCEAVSLSIQSGQYVSYDILLFSSGLTSLSYSGMHQSIASIFLLVFGRDVNGFYIDDIGSRMTHRQLMNRINGWLQQRYHSTDQLQWSQTVRENFYINSMSNNSNSNSNDNVALPRLRNIPIGSGYAAPDLEYTDAVTWESVPQHEALYLQPNANLAGGRVDHVYSHATMKNLLPQRKSPFTREPFHMVDVKRLVAKAATAAVQNR